MNECSKSVARRLQDVSYVRWFCGRGIDVGCGLDSIAKWFDLFPLMGEVQDWDKAQGDAQTLDGIKDGTFDWLHSSHCLEHIADPYAALKRWCMVVRPGGAIVVMVPDEDLYEQEVWPSRFNSEHQHTFTICKNGHSWCPASIDVFDLIKSVAWLAAPVRVQLLDGTYLKQPKGIDQTLNLVTESAIEFVLVRRT